MSRSRDTDEEPRRESEGPAFLVATTSCAGEDCVPRLAQLSNRGRGAIRTVDFKTQPKTDFVAAERLRKKDAVAEGRALREGIRHHDHLYFVKNQPVISDAVYDRLFRRLEELEEVFPELRSDDSPTRRIGAEPVDELAKVRHATPMLSLQAVQRPQEVEAFAHHIRRQAEGEEVAYRLEPKFDGLSVELVYKTGHFERAVTRGNGEMGEDTSHNVKVIGAVPLVLREPSSAPAFLAVRAEVFLHRKGFLALNRERVERNEEPLANPRNAAAAALRAVPEVDEEIAHSVTDLFSREENRRVLERLTEAGVRVKEVPHREANRRLEGKTFALTGTLEHFTRDEAKARIERLGERATSSLSGRTDYLVIGKDPEPSGTYPRHVTKGVARHAASANGGGMRRFPGHIIPLSRGRERVGVRVEKRTRAMS